MEPLLCTPGREYYLVTDNSHVLKALHYRTPLLESCGSTLKLYTQKEARNYKICFDMTSEMI
jgi:hypothetical protein